ncbi:MAG: hypothetical protein LLG20_18300 [Acidobacteriales bacterium]|nr:hypothetical protein [Terriglobales bacterium]
MRLLNRKDFLKLPAGTVYCSGEPYAFTGLHVKGETLPYNDFVCLDLQRIDAHDSGEEIDRLEDMRYTGVSFPMNTNYGRDGGFDDKEVFLVYERGDLEFMAGVMKGGA